MYSNVTNDLRYYSMCVQHKFRAPYRWYVEALNSVQNIPLSPRRALCRSPFTFFIEPKPTTYLILMDYDMKKTPSSSSKPVRLPLILRNIKLPFVMDNIYVNLYHESELLFNLDYFDKFMSLRIIICFT